MPPKIYRRPPRDDQKPKNEEAPEKAQLTEKCTIIATQGTSISNTSSKTTT